MGQAGVVTSRFSQRCHTGRPHQRRDAAIFFAIDYCPLEVVGIHAAKRCTRFEALEPILPGVRHSFEALGKDVTKGRTLRHDHGSKFIADDLKNEIKYLGIADSTSYVREPQGNGIAVRFVRILKENLLWIRSFNTVEEFRLAPLAFRKFTTTDGVLVAGMTTIHRLRSGSSRRPKSPRPPNFP